MLNLCPVFSESCSETGWNSSQQHGASRHTVKPNVGIHIPSLQSYKIYCMDHMSIYEHVPWSQT
jgi:hypothetical protein